MLNFDELNAENMGILVNFWCNATVADVTSRIENGANVNHVHQYLDSLTPLHFAAWFSAEPEIIEALLVAGASSRAQENRSGCTPLHLAARYNNNVRVIEKLLGAADVVVDARDNNDRTPLHAAAWGTRNGGIITALLNAGADKRLIDRNGRTPLNAAQDNMNGSSAPLL